VLFLSAVSQILQAQRCRSRPKPVTKLPEAAQLNSSPFKPQQPASKQQQPTAAGSLSTRKLPQGAIVTRPNLQQQQQVSTAVQLQLQHQQQHVMLRRQSAAELHASRAGTARRLQASRAFADAASQSGSAGSQERLRNRVHPWPYYKPQHRGMHELFTMWCNKTLYTTL